MPQGKLKNIVGQKFGKWTVLKRAANGKTKSARWLCKCECGNTNIIRGADLRLGKTKSCGCARKERFKKMIYKHGLDGTRINRIYWGMKARCYNKNFHKYKYYGARGITICEEWKNDFLSFYSWAINNGYKNNLSIDRINNDGNYEPSNCRWATAVQQANNKRQKIK